ncbi:MULTISPECIES: (2Fe-2S)-binding protein [Shinella]|uniref:(2Fe-2S)-binding protein n=1 Tax=Shinella sumterensis TaxID=1967501 RepID=A0AA50H618_9HYPH|nr:MULTISPECIES: (2Fe-2S)-binding protein [Shinella]MCD1266365.1 2Fe-2S iron-sulfur cluster binding domain-containing protein [Shinella sumterensis]TFE97248.1 oxidoreductase [Shinella sumterensis]UPA26847.1 (2Fe-2S)-binding protein [Shinella oryzae]WLR99584.1 (2Fe-2S)-binding protein [Shinella sumterensis]WLS10423.1 (2Fe-2S)-binding protein [Shinella sumterensis]
MSDAHDSKIFEVTRRQVLEVGTIVSMSGMLPAAAQAQGSVSQPTPENGATVRVSFQINGQPGAMEIDARASLLDMLRERLGLAGAKKGCDHGQCGACTVHIDGRRVASCLTLAAKVDGRTVTTIEGIGSADALHPMQQAFIDHDALQCGYCTPGQIMAAIACVKEGHASTPEDIREYMSGNICRCGAYVGIVAAIQQAAPQIERG